ncbi:MAG: class I SAM-dependent methyltransferase [Clostridia bacterium]|nr:class I SAM-dependent methyltransferase [Clostridia bacterium]
MDRIKKLCSYLSPCTTFADIGCDHGYCTQYMLKNRLCGSAVISDVSAKSLSKAENLLKEYIQRGICRAVCCDGLTQIDVNCDLVLIAGMGGEEVVKILRESFIPNRFVFQPMKNAEVLREYLIKSGCGIEHDGIFYSSGKYYFVVKGARQGGTNSYSPAQLAFGRDSLGTAELKGYLSEELSKTEEYLLRELSPANRDIILKRKSFIQGVLSGDVT